MPIAFTKVALPYGWLGNMSPHPVFLLGVRWRTAEHAFQALRLPMDHPMRSRLNEIKSPMEAKMAVKPYQTDFVVIPRSDEDLELMRLVTIEKLCQNGLQEELASTGDQTIIEDVTKRPHGNNMFWGAALIDGQWVGENQLGHIWMDHRSFLFS